jgi:Kef-type K+ transport system membrane component KefB
MTALTLDALFVVCLLGAAAPLILGYLPRLRLPSAVLEIAAGVVIGPSVLGWVEPDEPVLVAGLLGLAVLLFLAGLEIDPGRAHRQEVELAVGGYALSLALAALVALGLAALGWVHTPALVAVALSATSLGLVVPILRDAGEARTALGQAVIVGGSVADVGSIVLLSVLFGAEGGPASRLVLLFTFAVVVVTLGLGVVVARRSTRTRGVIDALQDSTAQIRIRLSVLLLVGLTALAARFGLETILGAFLAGLVLSILDRRPQEHPRLRTGLDAIGFGFLVPVFYVVSGLQLDISGLVSGGEALLQVAALIGALLVVRGAPALLHLSALGARRALAAGLLQATSLPFLVTAAMVGRELGLVTSTTATALVTSGVVSVAVFPTLAYALLRSSAAVEQAGRPPSGVGG